MLPVAVTDHGDLARIAKPILLRRERAATQCMHAEEGEIVARNQPDAYFSGVRPVFRSIHDDVVPLDEECGRRIRDGRHSAGKPFK